MLDLETPAPGIVRNRPSLRLVGVRPLADFLDYRQFLLEHYLARRRANPRLSYRGFSFRLGMDVSQVYRILHGRCHLSPRSASHVAVAVGLEGAEADHFRLLVEYGRARSEEARLPLLEAILRHRERLGHVPSPEGVRERRSAG